MCKALKDLESLCAAWCWLICACSGKSFRKWDSSLTYGQAYWIAVWVSVSRIYDRGRSRWQTRSLCLCVLPHQICFVASYLLEMEEGRVEKQERKRSRGEAVGSQLVGGLINFGHSNYLKYALFLCKYCRIQVLISWEELPRLWHPSRPPIPCQVQIPPGDALANP